MASRTHWSLCAFAGEPIQDLLLPQSDVVVVFFSTCTRELMAMLLTSLQWRLLLAGLYPVEWRDFYLGDMFCSLTYSMSVSIATRTFPLLLTTCRT